MDENILNNPMDVQLISGPELQEAQDATPDEIEPSGTVSSTTVASKPEEGEDKIEIPKSVFESIVESSLKIPENSEKETNIQPIYPGLINRGEILVLKAIAGAGATWFAIALAVALSKVSSLFSHFEYAKASKEEKNDVVLFESGMSSEQIIERFRLLKTNQPKNLQIILKDLNFVSASVQPSMLDWAKKKQNFVMIFDRLSSLAYSDPDGTAEDFHKWIIEMKEAGVTMIWIDQGKSGSFDLPYDHVDTELQLSTAKNRENLAIKVDYLRARNLKKSDTAPFVIELQESENEDGLHFVHHSIEADKKTTAIVLAAKGEHTQTQIASKLTVSQGTISNWLRDAVNEKIIERKGQNIWLTKKGGEMTKNFSFNPNY